MAYDPSAIIGAITHGGAIGDAGNAVGMDRSDAYGYLYQYFCQFSVLDEIRINQDIIKRENRPMVMIIGRFLRGVWVLGRAPLCKGSWQKSSDF